MKSDQTRRRMLAVTAILASAGALAFLAFGGVGKNLVYYWSPSELQANASKAVGASIRLGGLVAPGSIHHGQGLSLSFAVTDGKQTVPVVANAVPPAMFRENIGVVVEGTMGKDGQFHTNRLMVKHDNEYRPPGKDDPRDMKELMKSLQVEDN